MATPRRRVKKVGWWLFNVAWNRSVFFVWHNNAVTPATLLVGNSIGEWLVGGGLPQAAPPPRWGNGKRRQVVANRRLPPRRWGQRKRYAVGGGNRHQQPPRRSATQRATSAKRAHAFGRRGQTASNGMPEGGTNNAPVSGRKAVRIRQPREGEGPVAVMLVTAYGGSCGYSTGWVVAATGVKAATEASGLRRSGEPTPPPAAVVMPPQRQPPTVPLLQVNNMGRG